MSIIQQIIITDSFRRVDNIDGQYYGVASGNTVFFEIKGIPYEFKTHEAVKGIDYPAQIDIANGVPQRVLLGEEFRSHLSIALVRETETQSQIDKVDDLPKTLPSLDDLISGLRDSFTKLRELDVSRRNYGPNHHSLQLKIAFYYRELKQFDNYDKFSIEWRRNQLIVAGYSPHDNLNSYNYLDFKHNEHGHIVVA